MRPRDQAGGVPAQTAIRALVHAADARPGLQGGWGQRIDRQG